MIEKFSNFTILFFIMLLLSVHGTAGAACSDDPVTIQNVRITSPDMENPVKFSVFIPPCYDERISEGYPVIYLLHGQNMDESVWQNMGLQTIMQEGQSDMTLPRFIIVTIQEDNYLQELFYSKFDKAIVETIIPWIDSNYNTCSDRTCRAIGGISRGALWAEKIAFSNLDLFGAVGLHSIPGTVFDDQSLQVLIKKQFDENCLLRVYIDVGSEDDYRHEGRAFSDQLNFFGYSHIRLVNPGGHDEAYWSSQLLNYLIWYSEKW
ncbi:MAG: alpha/beta hydrolase [Flexilinea sp.]